jgi:hypothetical protein
MTDTTATRFLATIADDSDERARLVEVLRNAAAILDGSDFYQRSNIDEGIKERVRQQLAATLRKTAARLCDHARVHGDECRYCESIITHDSGSSAESMLAAIAQRRLDRLRESEDQ